MKTSVKQDRTNHTPKRDFRVQPDLWAKAQKRAAEKGETVSDAIRAFLEQYSRGA